MASGSDINKKFEKFVANKIPKSITNPLETATDKIDSISGSMKDFVDPIKDTFKNPLKSIKGLLPDLGAIKDSIPGIGSIEKLIPGLGDPDSGESGGIDSKSIESTIGSGSEKQIEILEKILFSLRDVFKLTETGQEKIDRIAEEEKKAAEDKLRIEEEKNASNKLSFLEKKSEVDKKGGKGPADSFLTDRKKEEGEAGGFFGKFAKAFKTIKKVFSFVSNSIGLIVEFGAVALGVFALFGAAKTLYNEIQDGVAPLTALGDAIQSFFSTFLTTIPDFIKGMLSGLAGLLGFTGIEKFLDSFTFKALFGKGFTIFRNAIVGLFETIFDIATFKFSIVEIFDKITNLIFAPFDFLKDMISLVLNMFGATGASDFLNGFSFRGIINNIRNGFFGFFDSIVDFVVKLFTDPIGLFTSIKENILGFMDKLIHSPLDVLADMIDFIASLFSIGAFFIKIQIFTNGLLFKAFNAFTSFMSSIKNFIIDKLGLRPIITMLNSFVTNLIDTIVFGPINLLKSIGSYVLGLLGFKNASKALGSFSPKKFFIDIIDSIGDFMSSIVKSIVDIFSGPESVGKKISKLVGKIGAMATDLLKTLLRAILPKPGGSLLSLSGLASRAIPNSIYEFAGINPKTGKEEDTQKETRKEKTTIKPLTNLSERAQKQLERVLKKKRERESLAKLGNKDINTFEPTNSRSNISGNNLLNKQEEKRNIEVANQSAITDSSISNSNSSNISITNNAGSSTSIGQTSIPDRAGRTLDLTASMF